MSFLTGSPIPHCVRRHGTLGGMNLNFNFLVHLFPKPLSTTLLLALENCSGIRAVFEIIVMLCLMVPLFRVLEGI